jgi:hypothetical protein
VRFKFFDNFLANRSVKDTETIAEVLEDIAKLSAAMLQVVQNCAEHVGKLDRHDPAHLLLSGRRSFKISSISSVIWLFQGGRPQQ